MRAPTECWVAAIRRSPAARTGVRGEGGGLRKPRASAGCRSAGSRGSRGRRGGGGGRRAEEGREERRGQESGRKAAGEEARRAQQGRRGGAGRERGRSGRDAPPRPASLAPLSFRTVGVSASLPGAGREGARPSLSIGRRRRHVAPRPGARPGPRARRPVPAQRGPSRAPCPPAGARLPLLAQRPPPAGGDGECGAHGPLQAEPGPQRPPPPAAPGRGAGGAAVCTPGVPPAGLARSPPSWAELGKLPPFGMGSLKLSRALVAGDAGASGEPGEGAHRRGGRTPGSPARRCVTSGASALSGPLGRAASPRLQASLTGTPLRKTSRHAPAGPGRHRPFATQGGPTAPGLASSDARRTDPASSCWAEARVESRQPGGATPRDWVRPWPQGWGARRSLPPPRLRRGGRGG